jgi:hypothetical protein
LKGSIRAQEEKKAEEQKADKAIEERFGKIGGETKVDESVIIKSATR